MLLTANRRFITGAILVGLAGAWYWHFSTGYGPVKARTYELATALYSVCNRQDIEGLEKLADTIDRDVAAELIPTDEARMLQTLVDTASAGKWSRAAQESRNLLAAQVTHP